MCGNSVLIAIMDIYALIVSIIAKGNISDAGRKTNIIILYSLLGVGAITSIITTYLDNDDLEIHEWYEFGTVILWVILVTIFVIIAYCLFMATILFAVDSLQAAKFPLALFPYHSYYSYQPVFAPKHTVGNSCYYPVMDKRNIQFTALQYIS